MRCAFHRLVEFLPIELVSNGLDTFFCIMLIINYFWDPFISLINANDTCRGEIKCYFKTAAFNIQRILLHKLGQTSLLILSEQAKTGT